MGKIIDCIILTILVTSREQSNFGKIFHFCSSWGQGINKVYLIPPALLLPPEPNFNEKQGFNKIGLVTCVVAGKLKIM